MARHGTGGSARGIGNILWLLEWGIFVAWLWLVLAHPGADARLVARVMTRPGDAGCAARDFLRTSYFDLADIITVPVCQGGAGLIASAPAGTATRGANGVAVTVDMPPVVLAGEPVAVTLRVRDATSQPVEVPAMHLVLLSPAGRVVWTDTDATPIAVAAQEQLTALCPQDLAVRCLAPGAQATVRRVAPAQPTPGRYTLVVTNGTGFTPLVAAAFEVNPRPVAGPEHVARIRRGAVELALATDRAVYSRGRPIPVTLTLKDVGTAPLEPAGAATGYQGPLVTLLQGRTVLAQWPAFGFPMSDARLTTLCVPGAVGACLTPGQALRRTWTWPGTLPAEQFIGNTGWEEPAWGNTLAPAGTYTLQLSFGRPLQWRPGVVGTQQPIAVKLRVMSK